MAEYKEKTLCWKCQNYSKCSWSRGKPVEGWTAEKTLITTKEGLIIRYYKIIDCPKFSSDKIYYASCYEIASILGVSNSTASHLLNRCREQVERKLCESGYKLHRFDGDCGWYLEKIEKCNTDNELVAGR